MKKEFLGDSFFLVLFCFLFVVVVLFNSFSAVSVATNNNTVKH